MEIVEYPKAMTKDDDLRIVEDSAGEDLARADGFSFWSDASPDEQDDAGHTTASARAALDAKGAVYDKRLGLAKLLELLA